MSFAHLFITVILFLIYPTCKFGLYSWTKGQLEPFGFNKILGKCYYTDFIAILVYILYNVLLTCHLHIYNSNSVWIHPTCKFSLYTWTKAQLEYFASINILYNVLLTCHLHIYNSNSVLIHLLYEFNCAPWFKAQLEPFGMNKI